MQADNKGKFLNLLSNRIFLCSISVGRARSEIGDAAYLDSLFIAGYTFKYEEDRFSLMKEFGKQKSRDSKTCKP